MLWEKMPFPYNVLEKSLAVLHSDSEIPFVQTMLHSIISAFDSLSVGGWVGDHCILCSRVLAGYGNQTCFLML